MPITVTPTGAALGAEIAGVDLRRSPMRTSRRCIAPGWITGAAVPRADTERR